MDGNPEALDAIWSVLLRLAALHQQPEFSKNLILGREPSLEECLRRVLRPHDEAGFQSKSDRWMVTLRLDLDKALNELTLREIRFELGLEPPPLREAVLESLRTLINSEAFLRYLDAYLYFGVRLLASRKEFVTKPDAPCADSNTRPLPLAFPPGLAVEGAQQAVDRLLVHMANDGERGEVRTALGFLDGFHPLAEGKGQYGLEEMTSFELWLRGLMPEADADQASRFQKIRNGLVRWSVARSDFYLSLNALSQGTLDKEIEPEGTGNRPPQGWLSTHPIAARLALADVYWIARLLGADVSSIATVHYRQSNWLQLLRFNAIYRNEAPELAVSALEKAEESLRSVFDYVCDLVQNSIEVTRDKQGRSDSSEPPASRPPETMDWRAVSNEELREIEAQRKIRHFRDPSLPPDITTGKAIAYTSSDGAVWSDRITTGERPLNLIGLAFSGGGIRSATVNLGVLQGLQELDLLRHIDFLSTVSGGGFIGAWFAANIRRSAHWLGRMTDWSASIAHLRAYSNYLAPRTGLLSADTWNLANSWFRNAFLIQLTGLAWLLVLLLLTLQCMQAFFFIATPTTPLVIGSLAAIAAFVAVLVNLHGTSASSNASRRSAKWVRRNAVIPACIGGYALAASLWAQAYAWAPGRKSADIHYSEILRSVWHNGTQALTLALSLVMFLVISLFTLRRQKQWSVWIALLCSGVVYLELAGILYLFRLWAIDADASNCFPFVFGPPLVLASFGISVLLLIGFTGRNTNEAQREWWTRYGTWLAIFAGLALILSSVAILSPHLMWRIFHQVHPNKWLEGIKWTSLVSWIGTVLGGLFAGKSSKTAGETSTKSPALQVLANLGGLLFILGSLISGATLLVLILWEMETPASTTEPLSAVFLSGLVWWRIPVCLAVVFLLGCLFSRFFEINIFGLNQFYRNRLVRCYLGATRWMPGARKPNPFTGFDFRDDLDLSRFCTRSTGEGLLAEEGFEPRECGDYRGPFPLINCTLNLGGSADLALNTRHSDSFTLTPLRCGSSRPRVGYSPTTSATGKFADGVRTGQAVAISGAAVSSNMGYNTSPLVAFLLTMFNLRLGWWFPNPSRNQWNKRGLNSSFRYLLAELFGMANENLSYLNVSDGGHFENLGIYELVRRRCRLIIACDAECDEFLEFGGLGNLIRICETDFGVTVEIDVKSIRKKGNDNSLSHCAIGIIKYSSGEIGRLIYLKASMTGDEDVSIAQYRSSHPSFPHETTANQFFTEDQFESYRALGRHMVRTSFKDTTPGDDPLQTAERLSDLLAPVGCATSEFLKHSRTLARIWDDFRCSRKLWPFMTELISPIPHPSVPASVNPDELCIGLTLIQLMEDVFLDLRLEEFWAHPDNRGWAFLFMRWARSPRLRAIWKDTHRTFGIRFEYFCNARLGLTRDQPITRV